MTGLWQCPECMSTHRAGLDATGLTCGACDARLMCVDLRHLDAQGRTVAKRLADLGQVEAILGLPGPTVPGQPPGVIQVLASLIDRAAVSPDTTAEDLRMAAYCARRHGDELVSYSHTDSRIKRQELLHALAARLDRAARTAFVLADELHTHSPQQVTDALVRLRRPDRETT